jgi:anti-sigma regulatory factor (Ser/Thr protein kinase)
MSERAWPALGRPKKNFVIRIPIQATVTYVDNFLKAVRVIRELENKTVIFDLKQTKEISPIFVCFICGLRDLAQQRNNEVLLVMPRSRPAAKTVQKIKPLFPSVGRPPLTVAERILQLRKVESNNPSQVQELVDSLALTAGMSNDLKFNVLLVLTELLTNTIDHSGDRMFYVCAGSWGRSRNLHITALDFGIGIPQKIRTRYPELKSDKALVERLLRRGGLTTRTDREGGRGYQIVREVLRRNGGRVHLFSGFAKAIMRFDRNEYIFRLARKEFSGTCVDLQFDLDGKALYTAATDHEDVGEFF